jgi:uncharacterized protein YjbJ (UPF0337 family)
MNWDTIEGQWKQFKGQVKSKWEKLTDEDMANLAGKKSQLVGKIQERYGVLRDDAEKQVDAWLEKLGAAREKVQEKLHEGRRGEQAENKPDEPRGPSPGEPGPSPRH